jgi:23S rRNA (guanosine2251-2'-O)-methyltransferase
MQKSDIVPGLQSVYTVLSRNPERLLEVFVETASRNPRVQAIIAQCEQYRISVQVIQPDRLDQLCQGVHHQGVAARCRPQTVLTETDLDHIIANQASPFLLALDEVTDPHNLGACLRTAEAAGVQAVIIPSHKSAQITPAVRKVSCGASELIPLIRVGNLVRTMKRIKQAGVWAVGTTATGQISLFDCDLSRPTLVVLGAEGSGLRRLTEEHCDVLANLPIMGGVESLNVSVATGICLYEVLRQRRNP